MVRLHELTACRHFHLGLKLPGERSEPRRFGGHIQSERNALRRRRTDWRCRRDGGNDDYDRPLTLCRYFLFGKARGDIG